MKLVLKIFKPIGAWIGRSKIASWVKTPGARTAFNVVSSAATVYTLVDPFFNAKEKGAAQREMTLAYLNKNIITPTIARALAQDINDSEAVSHAASLTGLALLSDASDSSTITGLAYCTLAKYLEEMPSGTAFSPEEIRKTLSKEFHNFLATVDNDGGVDGDVAEDSLEDLEFEEMPTEVLRQFDFLVFFINEVAEYAVDEDGNIEPTLSGAPAARTQSAAAKPKMGLI